jgi:hypothetical protein
MTNQAPMEAERRQYVARLEDLTEPYHVLLSEPGKSG